MSFTITSAHGVVGTTGRRLEFLSARTERWVLLPGPAFREAWEAIEASMRETARVLPIGGASAEVALRSVQQLANDPGRAAAILGAAEAERALDLRMLDADGRTMDGRVAIAEYPAPGSPLGDGLAMAFGYDPVGWGFAGPAPHYHVALYTELPRI